MAICLYCSVRPTMYFGITWTPRLLGSFTNLKHLNESKTHSNIIRLSTLLKDCKKMYFLKSCMIWLKIQACHDMILISRFFQRNILGGVVYLCLFHKK